ncbi:helix-turn-helix domain-containing protein [Bradyrhizobium sp. 166]|nr:helix-turn-helix domain-containing protein [Bradyrhizobium sp. 166]
MLTCTECSLNKQAVAKLGVDRSTVAKWRHRFVSGGAAHD